MSALENEAVIRVRKALVDAGMADTVMEMADTARSAEDAAESIGCTLGAIAKSLVFSIEENEVQHMVMALIAGDHQCVEAALVAAFNLTGTVRRPRASEVKEVTGFSIGGVPPIGLMQKLPVVIDRSLKRFDAIYAAAGHPHCVFKTDVTTLSRLTGGLISQAIGLPDDPNRTSRVNLKASRSLAEKRLLRARE